MIKYIIVDDNKLARMALKQVAGQAQELYFTGEYSSAMDAYNAIQNEHTDLILLDIEMPQLSGLEFAKILVNKNTLVIFTTGKSEYAINAFETNVVDYIIKPVSLPRFLTAIQKVKEIIENRLQNPSSVPEYFFVKDKGALKKVLLSEVLFFEAMGDYVKIHTKEKTFAIHTTLKNVEQKLDADVFIRVHRSYIVSVHKIDSVEDGTISILKNGIPVADAYKSLLNKKLNIL